MRASTCIIVNVTKCTRVNKNSRSTFREAGPTAVLAHQRQVERLLAAAGQRALGQGGRGAHLRQREAGAARARCHRHARARVAHELGEQRRHHRGQRGQRHGVAGHVECALG